ncbi:hypothetical protein FOZ62_005062, partial [Perkinsus olseni]
RTGDNDNSGTDPSPPAWTWEWKILLDSLKKSIADLESQLEFNAEHETRNGATGGDGKRFTDFKRQINDTKLGSIGGTGQDNDADDLMDDNDADGYVECRSSYSSGNGYSGSLKQKLTSDALVLPVQQQIQGIASPLHEHFYAGLQDKRHVLLVECDEDACDVDKKVQFASANDAAARQTVEHANSYMARFDHYSLCYTWRLLQLYSDLLRYPLEDEPRNRNPTVRVHRYAPQHLPTRAEEEAWREACLQDMDNHSV